MFVVLLEVVDKGHSILTLSHTMIRIDDLYGFDRTLWLAFFNESLFKKVFSLTILLFMVI